MIFLNFFAKTNSFTRNKMENLYHNFYRKHQYLTWLGNNLSSNKYILKIITAFSNNGR